MRQWSSREVIQALKADGWYEVACVGSHHQFKHPTKKGRTTVKDPCKTFRDQRSTASSANPV